MYAPASGVIIGLGPLSSLDGLGYELDLGTDLGMVHVLDDTLKNYCPSLKKASNVDIV